MYSEALAIMDKNTVEYMIDEMRAEIQRKDRSLEQKNTALQKKDALIRELQNRLTQFEQK